MNFKVDYNYLNRMRTVEISREENAYQRTKKEIQQKLQETETDCVSAIEKYYAKHDELPKNPYYTFGACKVKFPTSLYTVKLENRLRQELNDEYNGGVIFFKDLKYDGYGYYEEQAIGLVPAYARK